MLRVLPESRPSRERRAGSTLLSVAAHTGVIALVVVATARANDPGPADPAPIERRSVVYVPAPTRRASVQRPSDGARSTREAGPVAVPTPQVDFSRIPTSLPPVDAGPRLDDLLRDPRDVARTGHAGDDGQVGRRIGDGEPYTRETVDQVAAIVGTPPRPRYPERLRQAQVEGRVVVRFVVDTLGRVEPASFQVMQFAHDLFAEAARSSVMRLRFAPARAGGGKVRMLVELPFEFALQR